MSDDAVPLDAELRAALNERADKDNRFEPTSLPQVLSCRDCKALVLEDNRGEHYSWHLWLDEHTWDNETLMSYHLTWHAEDEEAEDQEPD